MRRGALPDINDVRVNVTPLIDVVMCLIIFFMLVAKIGVDTGSDRQIVVPASFLGVDLKDLGNTLTLNVTNGPYLANGEAQPLVTCMLRGQRQEIRIRAQQGGQVVYPLYDALRELKQANPRFRVILRADENTEYQYLQPVLAECTRAGVTYDFATQKGEAPPQ
jgi:biopolymer transport protein ExbD